MAHLLKFKELEIQIELPLENYCSSRFDWTGKIKEVKFRNIPITSLENKDNINENHFGKGFYNEFGIDCALGFDETKVGGWFHKIGIGLLKKDDNHYRFDKAYEIKPADFDFSSYSNKAVITCKSESVNGYRYILRKEIEVHENAFSISYHLHNTGEKEIITNEYNHNFIAINKDPIGANYKLKFPFNLKPELFIENINPEQKVEFGRNEILFTSVPKEAFYFSKLSGNETVDSKWELINQKNKIRITENGSFKTNRINLWGTSHVISPELFFEIDLKPGQSREWSRTYNFYQIS
jgi:hypothetical protein